MCNSPTYQHDDLNDDPADIFGLAPLGSAPRQHAPVDTTLADAAVANARRFEERCPACRGSGTFVSYSGRVVGYCFKCKGKGKLLFKTSSEDRAKAADQRARKADQRAKDIAADAAAWAVAFPADHAWIVARAGSFEFAAAMRDALAKYGSLTERQHAAVTRLQLADADRKAAQEKETAARNATAQDVNVARIEEAFAAAQAHGIKRPKTYLGDYKFSLAPAHGRNAGALYVTSTESDAYLGKIMGGKFFRVRECGAVQEAEIVAVASDPKEAAIAFGRRTGRCSCCGRELTNHASIDLGIGPICAEKYGW